MGEALGLLSVDKKRWVSSVDERALKRIEALNEK
jgi:hypothetical protein